MSDDFGHETNWFEDYTDSRATDKTVVLKCGECQKTMTADRHLYQRGRVNLPVRHQ